LGWENKFLDAIKDNLNIPKALDVFWSLLDEINIDTNVRLKLLEKFDSVLGLGIKDMKKEKISIPKEVKDLVTTREEARTKKMWAEADILRERIKERGFIVEDVDGKTIVRKI